MRELQKLLPKIRILHDNLIRDYTDYSPVSNELRNLNTLLQQASPSTHVRQVGEINIETMKEIDETGKEMITPQNFIDQLQILKEKLSKPRSDAEQESGDLIKIENKIDEILDALKEIGSNEHPIEMPHAH